MNTILVDRKRNKVIGLFAEEYIDIREGNFIIFDKESSIDIEDNKPYEVDTVVYKVKKVGKHLDAFKEIWINSDNEGGDEDESDDQGNDDESGNGNYL